MIRCERCARFTANNRAMVNLDMDVRDARGDCSRCGPGVPVRWEAWEDWGWTEDDEREIQDRIIGSVTAE